jgi:hypothetical protein
VDHDLVQWIHVKGVALTAKLVEAGAYHTESRFVWVRTFGEDMMRREQALLTVAHLGSDNQHWVGLIVDAKERAIHYGDSLKSPIPHDLLQTYQWWIVQLTICPQEPPNHALRRWFNLWRIC